VRGVGQRSCEQTEILRQLTENVVEGGSEDRPDADHLLRGSHECRALHSWHLCNEGHDMKAGIIVKKLEFIRLTNE
jgi:hypothetical protein